MSPDLPCPERRQTFLLPPDMRDWLPEDDIVHLILDAVALMDLAAFETTHKLGGAGQAPVAPSMLLSVLIYAYSHGVRSSRAIERLCGRDAGYRFIVGEHVPDHTVIARFRRRHVERLEAVFVRVLEMCRDAGLIRLGLVVLDGTKVKANASLEANRSAATIDQQVARMVAEAESTDRREDRLFGPDGRETLPKALARREDRLARLRVCQAKLECQAAAVAARQQAKIDARAAEEQATGKRRRGRKPKPADSSVDPDRVANPTDPESGIMKTRQGWVQGYLAQAVVEMVMGEDAVLGAAAADAGYWSEDNAASQTAECELFIAARQDHQQRAELRDVPAPRGRMPKRLTARERMQRKLRTKRGRAIYRQRGASVEPVFGQMKERQDAGRFSMRGLVACRGEWHLQAATHNLRKLHRESVRRARSATARHPADHRTEQRTA